jgi:3-oxoadipate enol-lactonase
MRNATAMQTSGNAPAEAWIEVHGARLRYRDEGHGPAVVLLHGWALDLEMWQPQVAAWAASCRTIRIDRRGFGGSAGQPSTAQDIPDLMALVDHLGLARFALLGMSQGARVALRAATQPALGTRLTCLVLDGVPLAGPSRELPPEVPIVHYRELVRRRGLEGFRAEWSEHPFTRLHTSDASAHRLLRGMTERYRAADLLAAYDDGPEPASDEPPALAAMAVPTLVINGERDTEVRRQMGEEVSRLLPRAQYAVIRGAGHLPNLDNPRVYNDLVLDFVTRHAHA